MRSSVHPLLYVVVVFLLASIIPALDARPFSNGTTTGGKGRGPKRINPPLMFRTNSTADEATVNAWIASILTEAHNRRQLAGYSMRSVRKWVSAHNEERAKHFEGGELVWDRRIAAFAAQHTESIVKNANCAAEFNEDNEEYGENLYWAVYEHGQDPWSIYECVQEWAKQGTSYDYDTNKCAEGEDCEAFLQVVWKQTQRLGCAEVFCPYHGDFKGVAQFFVCNYFPPAATSAREDSQAPPKPW